MMTTSPENEPVNPTDLSQTDDEITPIEEQTPPALVLSTATYEALRAMVEVILPGVSALWLALAGIWGWSNGEKISGTIAAVTVFVGLFVRVARRSYNKSDLKYDGFVHMVDKGQDKAPTMSLEVAAHPSELMLKKEINFKVVNR